MSYEVIAGLQGLGVTSSPGSVLAGLKAVLSPWLRERLRAPQRPRPSEGNHELLVRATAPRTWGHTALHLRLGLVGFEV